MVLQIQLNTYGTFRIVGYGIEYAELNFTCEASMNTFENSSKVHKLML